MIRNTAQTKQTNIAPNTILPSLSGRAHQLTIPATATLAMGSLFIGSLSSVKTTACTNPRLGSTGWNTFTCCWTAPKRHINKWVRIIPTITVGQRKKVTAVTFFRCPTVTMKRMWSNSASKCHVPWYCQLSMGMPDYLISPWTKWPTSWQTTISDAFSWMKMIEFKFKFHWNLFPGVQLTINQHWFR